MSTNKQQKGAKANDSSRTRWSFDLNLREQDVGYSLLQQQYPPPFGSRRVRSAEKQLEGGGDQGGGSGGEAGGAGGGGGTGTTSLSQQAQALAAKKKARAMEMAMSPGKQIGMNAFMMYMSGSTLNIFSISITSMAILSPLKAIFSLSNAFKQFEDPDGKVDLQMPKLIFFALNLVWFGVGMYKMGNMRLLPTTSADWTGSVVWKQMLETSSVPSAWT